MSNKTKLLCLFLKAQKTDKLSEQGYAMAMVSIITIILFSLMGAATILSNMAKTRTNAFVDSTSAFYVAEAGLNKRAAEIDKILRTYAGVKTVASSPTEVGACFEKGIPAGGSGESVRAGDNDLECVNYRFQSSNNIARATLGSDVLLDSGGQDRNTYVAYTLVNEDKRNYVDGKPPYAIIPGGEAFEGLNAISYTYRVSSIGKKPVALPNTSGSDTATAANQSSNNVTLSMTFTNRVVPLFQFGIFYDGDLELNSTTDMQINGWVHSNANMYLQPARVTGTNPITTFLSNVSAAGSIYNRVDAWINSPDNAGSPTLTGGSRLLLGTSPDVYRNIDLYDASVTDPLSTSQIDAFNTIKPGALKDGVAGATRLTVPSPSFGRKRNYKDNKIGEAFARADMRLEMVPDRDIVTTGGTTTNMGGKTANPWTRNKAIIPFNFTAITTGGGNGSVDCTTATPAAGLDPVATYVDPERENYSNLRCNVFSKGKLQSLRQPVMVLTEINQTRDATTTATPTFKERENTALPGRPGTLDSLSFVLSTTANTDPVKLKIIRALQVAIASTSKPLSLNQLNLSFGATDYLDTTQPELAEFKTTFTTLLNNIPSSELSSVDRGNLLTLAKPTAIAALRGAWFLPAPIQRVEPAKLTDVRNATNNNLRSSGFYDGREQRWMTMLQTNIASLSVWNRDSIYVEDTVNPSLTTAYNPGMVADILPAFSNALAATPTSTGANLANGLAFDRVTTFIAGGNEIYKTVGTGAFEYTLQYLGLGSRDKTEGGLVFHATVNDDLNGSGTIDANDVNFDNTQDIQARNASGTLVTVDYLRTYPTPAASKRSLLAFAFNGGNYLPGAMTLVSDQSIYVQGNFNNNATIPSNIANTPTAADPSRLPAAILADTITVLSNECMNGTGVPRGQLSCGLRPIDESGADQAYNPVTSALSINAAFLSNTQVSTGNLGTGRGYSTTTSSNKYSGGANNYIRLLENWYRGNNPYALNYSGSLVSLNQPIENSGEYRAGGLSTDTTRPAYYDVPFRNVNYDTKFNDNTKLPPLTPKASYVRQGGFSRTY